MSDGGLQGRDQVRTAEVVASLSLATDLAIGVPLEHGLHSAIIATRLGDILRVDPGVRAQAYYTSLLFYIGCTATARTASEVFGEDDALTTYAVRQVRLPGRRCWWGWRAPSHRPDPASLVRATQLARGIPDWRGSSPSVVRRRLRRRADADRPTGAPSELSALFVHVDRPVGRHGRARSCRG